MIHKKNRRFAALKISSVILGALVSGGCLANTSLEQWVKENHALFLGSPAAQQIDGAIRADDFRNDYYQRQSPFTLNTLLSRTDYQNQTTYDPYNSIVKSYQWTINNSLTYQLRNSLSAVFSANYSYTRLQPQTFTDPLNRPYQLGLQLSYDFLHGGSGGLSEAQARANIAQTTQDRFTNDGTLLSSKISFGQMLIDYFILNCKVREVRNGQSLVAEAVEMGRVQVRAKIISYTDFYNFLDLESTYDRQLKGAESERVALLEQAVDYGETVLTKLRTLEPQSLDCAPSLTDLDSRVAAVQKNFRGSPEIAKKLPSFKAAEAAVSNAHEQLSIARVTNLPSLAPFVGANYARADYDNQSLGYVTAGVNFVWNIPGPRGSSAVNAADAGLLSVTQGLEKAYRDNLARIQSLVSVVSSQENVLRVIEKGLKNSDQLLVALKAKRDIGEVDSLNFSVAYLNRLNAILAELDSWGTLQKSLYELSQYQTVRPSPAN